MPERYRYVMQTTQQNCTESQICGSNFKNAIPASFDKCKEMAYRSVNEVRGQLFFCISVSLGVPIQTTVFKDVQLSMHIHAGQARYSRKKQATQYLMHWSQCLKCQWWLTEPFCHFSQLIKPEHVTFSFQVCKLQFKNLRTFAVIQYQTDLQDKVLTRFARSGSAFLTDFSTR